MSKSSPKTPWLEWVVGALGALLFLGIFAVLLTNALSHTDAAPSISARVEAIEATATGYVVKFIAVNGGEVTAAQVRLEAQLVTQSGAAETREITFDYLPPHSERRGGFIFENDPRASALTIQADGYVDP